MRSCRRRFRASLSCPRTLISSASTWSLPPIRRGHIKLRDAVTALVDPRTSCRRSDFNYILIDCPPSLNLLTLNAMSAADGMLVPVQCEFFALEGLSQLKGTIDRPCDAQSAPRDPGRRADDVRHAHIALERSRRERARLLRPKVYETVIPRNGRIAEAPSHGKPILLYDFDCAGSQAYIRLATEIMERERRYKAA